jgi:hypothetical protein
MAPSPAATAERALNLMRDEKSPTRGLGLSRPQKSKGSFRSDDPTGPAYTTIHSLPV